jgi:hypothetical protein
MSSFILYNIMTTTEKYVSSLLHMNTWVSIFVFEPNKRITTVAIYDFDKLVYFTTDKG